MQYAFVISKTGYYLVRVVNQGGFTMFEQRFEFWERARAQQLCDVINNIGAWNAGRGAA